ncbi:hypothetical protein ASD83_10105 [Devosia sp. Root685]|nr:hypothetical protein ASD83_10105 [Devosia sp. Root685]
MISPVAAATGDETCAVTLSSPDCVLAALETASAQGNPSAKVELAQQLLKVGTPASAERAVRLLSGVAERGDAWATILLANLYRQGEAVDQDGAKAVALLEPLAKANNAGALTGLGELYLAGANNTPKDVPLAAAYFERAANTGDMWGKFQLASLLIDGQGVPRDIGRAVGLLEEVGKGGDPWVLITLGDLYAKGLVQPAERAIPYFEEAAATGNTAALTRLAQAYQDGLGAEGADRGKSVGFWEAAAAKGDSFASVSLARLLLDDGSEASVKRAVNLLDDGAARGEAWPATILADLLIRGDKVPHDAQRALDLLTPLAGEDNPAALTLLGDLYVKWVAPIASDPAMGRDYYEQAAALGELGAKNKLGLMLLAGTGGAIDAERGLKLLREVAEAGDGWAKIQLGDALTQGGAVGVDAVAARDYYKRALDQGIGAGAVKLGLLYLNGAGTLRADPAKAAEYFEAAAAGGDSLARIQLALMHFEGRGVAKDVGRSLELLGDAAPDSAWANGILGGYYADGRYEQPDYQKAKGFFDSAVRLGDASARFRFGGLLASGPLAAEHRAEGLELVRGAVAQGVPGAAVEMARLEMMGLAGAEGGKAAEGRLLGEVRRDDPAALRLLLQLYRAGGGGMPPSIAKAKASLDQYGNLLPPEAATFESMALYAAGPPTLTAMQSVGDRFGQLAAGDVTQAVQMLFWSNKNAYVYVLQQQLKKAERYGGTLDGRLTRSTIAAFNAACREGDAETQVCSMGPLTPDYAVLMSKQIASFDRGGTVN